MSDSFSYQVRKNYKGYKPLNLAVIDVLIPGMGMFEHRNYYWGAGYVGAKLAGAALIFIAARNSAFWHSASNSANSFQKTQSDVAFLKNPKSSEEALSNQELEAGRKPRLLLAHAAENKADSASLLLNYAILLEVGIFALSFFHTYYVTDKLRQKAEPFYEVVPDRRTAQVIYNAGYNFRF